MGSNSSRLEDNLRENKRKVNRTIRELDRQKLASERLEESMIAKLKTEARAGRMKNVRLMAKDVLRNRKMANHYCNMKSQMMALQSQLQTAHSTNLLSTNFKNVSDLMSQVNCNTNVTEFNKIMNNISQQGEMLNLKLEMMGEVMDDSLLVKCELSRNITTNAFKLIINSDSEGGLGEERAINKLLDDLGVDVLETLGAEKTPQNLVSSSFKKEHEEVTEEDLSERKAEMLEVEERINNLKK